MFDVKRLIAEVAARNGIRLEPDDPAIVLLTLNELMLEEIVSSLGSDIGSQMAGFESVMDHLEKRAGSILAREVKIAAQEVRAEIQKDISDASLRAAHLVHIVDQAHKRPARLRSFAFALVVSLVLAALSFYVGLTFRGR